MKKLVLVAVVAFVLPVFAYAQCETLTYQTESIPEFTLGVPAHVDLEAVGGTPPYNFEVTGGAFPAGLHMNSKGKIRGVPTEVADTTVFITLTDSQGCDLTQAFAVRVNP